MKTSIINNTMTKTLSVTLLLLIGASTYADDTFHCPFPTQYVVTGHSSSGQLNYFEDENGRTWETEWPAIDGVIDFDNTPFEEAHTNLTGLGVTCEVQWAPELNSLIKPVDTNDKNATAASDNFTADPKDPLHDEVCKDGYEQCQFQSQQ